MEHHQGPRDVAVYAGTFDPITNGHCDIVRRALRIFDRLVVAVALGTTKETLFSGSERVQMLQEALAALGDRVRVQSFDGLLVDFVRNTGASVIIRGLRAVTDYEYEAQMAVVNRHLDQGIETVYLMTSEHCSFISSSVVREVARLGGEVDGLVPPNVLRKLKERFKN